MQATPPHLRWPSRRRAAPLLAAALALATTWPALRNGWVGYDEGFYARAENLLLLSLAPSNLARLVTSAGPSYQHQPVGALSYALDQAVWGDEAPAGFHATDLALYAALTALVAAFARAAAGDLPGLRGRTGWAAFAAGAAFAAHPAHVESWAWIADRKDLLAALLALTALLLARRARRAPRGGLALLGLAHGAYLLSLGAKVSALGLGLLVALDAWGDQTLRGLPGRARARAAARAGLPFLAVGLVVSLAWLAAQRGFPVPLGGEGAAAPVAHRMLYPLRCLGAQVRLLAWPAGLAVHHLPHAGAAAWAWDLVPLALGGVGLALALRAGGAARALGALGAAWLVVGLAPTLNIVALGYVNERYLLWPSVGVAVAAGGAFARARASHPRLALALGALALAAGATRSVVRASDWRDARALWGSLARLDPASPYGHVGLAQAALAEGALAEARDHAERAWALAPAVPVVGATLEAVLRACGDEAAAERVLAARADPGADLARGLRALGRGDLDEAERRAERVLRAFPRHADAQVLSAKVRLARGDPPGALALLEPAAHHTGGADATLHAALAALATGRLDRAALHLEVAERRGPSWRTRLVASRLALARGGAGEALAAAGEARRLLGPPPEGWDQVGVALASAGDLLQAAEVLGALHARGAPPGLAYDLARVEALLGRQAAARAHLAEALRGDPSLAGRARADPALRGLGP